jgi:hypothetical protein
MIGGLVALRRPENPIGWLFCVAGLAMGLDGLGEQYALYALVGRPGSMPAGVVTAWLVSWLWTVYVGLLGGYLFLLFPNGRLLSRRWRPVAWLVAIGIVLAFAGFGLKPGPLNNQFSFVANPFGVDALASIWGLPAESLLLPMVVAIVASVVSLVVRFRRAHGDESAQLRWIVYAALLLPFGLFLAFVFPSKVSEVVTISGLGAIPVAAGIAILRYRLYDIDLIINRTLVYGSLTAILAGLYTASISLSQRVFVALTGEKSDAAVVLTTLLVAAAFTPVKGRLQAIVDRRFKETPDRIRMLKALAQQAQSVAQIIDARRLVRRTLEEAVAVFDSTGGALFWRREGELRLIDSIGASDEDYVCTIPLEAGDESYGLLALGPRRDGLEYPPDGSDAIQQTLGSILPVILLVGGDTLAADEPEAALR